MSDKRSVRWAQIEYVGAVGSEYGRRVGRYDANGNSVAGDDCVNGTCRELTGYDRDPDSGLLYAGARHYDPQLGMFLTNDPAREFASPYAYAGWNPVNFVDPNGAQSTPRITSRTPNGDGTTKVCLRNGTCADAGALPAGSGAALTGR